jgi:hypothetical protein
MFPGVPVVELGTGPATLELLPTFWPFQPVELTFCAVLPVSQPSTIPQDRSNKRTEALTMVSPWSDFIRALCGKETQEGFTEPAANRVGQNSVREAAGRDGLAAVLPA